MARYFGTNGVRGTFDQLGPELALRLSKAIGAFFGSGKILIARDARLTGETLRHAVVSGLLSVGCDVVDLGMVSSPTAEFMVKRLRAQGLIIITASHNPPEWNALKVVDGRGVGISRERGEEIERLLDKAPAKPENGKYSKYDTAVAEHIAETLMQVKALASAGRKVRVALDCGNGMAATIAPEIFKRLGCDVVLLNEKIDGRFPGRTSEPTEAAVEPLKRLVKEKKCDCGIAWDGDADRVVFVDENGGYLLGDVVFALCEQIVLSSGKKGKVVTTVATSRAIDDIAKKYGCPVVHTKIGAPYISEEIAKGGAVIGGEEVGGIVLPEISFAKDGMPSAALIVSQLGKRKLSEMLAEIPKYENRKTKIKCDASGKNKAMEAVKKYAKGKKLKTIEIDGVRVDFSDGWVIVRASGTEDYVRVFSEAKTAEKAEKLMEEYVEKVKKALNR